MFLVVNILSVRSLLFCFNLFFFSFFAGFYGTLETFFHKRPRHTKSVGSFCLCCHTIHKRPRHIKVLILFACVSMSRHVQDCSSINAIFITFSQQILRDRLLFTITNGQKINISSWFKLKQIKFTINMYFQNIWSFL